MHIKPMVSVVMPAHNARRTIGLALSSLVMQTLPDWEAIVVDDGSTDDTAALVGAMGDSRIKLIRQAQAGAGAARNRGLAETRGEYIAFLDADDFIFPEYLERALMMLGKSPGKTAVTNNAFFLQASGISPRRVYHKHHIPRALNTQRKAILLGNFVSILSVFPRQLAEDVPAFDTSLKRAEDWDYWIQASYAGWRFVHQKRPMAFINRTGESLTSATEAVAQSEADILRKAAQTLPLSKKQRAMIHERLRVGEPSLLLRDSVTAIKAKDYVRASRLHLTATRLYTRSPRSIAKALAFRALPQLVGRLRERGID